MDKKKEKTRENIIFSAGVVDHVSRQSEATSQMLQALEGVRYSSNGKDLGHLGKSLRGIASSKLHPDYKDTNIKQQAGFSAELLTEARENQKNILAGKGQRVRTADGLGYTNDQINDLYTLDEFGHFILGSQAQSKFLTDYKTVVNKCISDPKWEKYQNSKMSVPSDQFLEAKAYTQERYTQFMSQSQRATTPEARASALAKAENAKLIGENLVDSGVTLEEAIQARVDPTSFVQKETARNIHNSATHAAKTAFIVGGTVSIAKNIYAVACEDKSTSEAAVDVVQDSAVLGATAYGITATATTASLLLRHSKKELLRRAGNTSLPTMLTTASLEIGKSISSYAKGEITAEELLENLGEKGASSVAAAYGASVGTVLLPGVGSVVGGMIGYTISNMLYSSTLETLRSARLSHQRRLEIEAFCEDAIFQAARYQEEITRASAIAKKNRDIFYEDYFNTFSDCIVEGDYETAYASIGRLADSLGIKVGFETFEAFDEFMDSEEAKLVF